LRPDTGIEDQPATADDAEADISAAIGADEETAVLKDLQAMQEKKDESAEEDFDPNIDSATFEARWDEHVKFSVNEPPFVTAKGPAGWEAEDYVDLEFDRVGLPPEKESALHSAWGVKDGIPHPAMNVLWPHRTLDVHRRRPFASPASPTDSSSPPKERQQRLKENRDRLQTLWQFSNSHGVSWDELDAAYGEWSVAGKKRYERWMQHKQTTRAKADHVAWYYLKRRCKPEDDPRIVKPGAMNRVQARLYFAWKKHYLRMHRPGRLSEYLRQFVAGKMIRRETNDRVFGLISPNTRS
jgi:hypothetical protein